MIPDISPTVNLTYLKDLACMNIALDGCVLDEPWLLAIFPQAAMENDPWPRNELSRNAGFAYIGFKDHP